MLPNVLLAAAFASLLAAQTPPPSQEGLVFRQPDGFVAWSSAGDETFYTADFRPEADKSGPPTASVGFQAFRDQIAREPVAYNDGFAEERRAQCADTTSQLLSSGQENGMDTAVTLVVCPNQSDGRSSYEFVESVRGQTIFLFVTYRLYAAPDAQQRQAVIDYLGTVTLCRKTNGKC